MRLRRCADPSLVAATVQFRNRTGVARYQECRLFRNDPRIRFHNVIHETMLGDVHAIAASDGLRIGRSPLALDHFGYDGDLTRKHHRNIPLLRTRPEHDPGHIYSWNHLGESLAGIGDHDAAVAAWKEAIRLVRQGGPGGALDALPYGALLLHATGAEPELLDEARARFPDDLLFRWLAGLRAARAERFEEAIGLLEPLVSIDPDTFCSDDGIAYDARIFGRPTRETLALAYFRCGRFDDAARGYGELLAGEPESAEYRVKQQLALARASQSRGANLHRA